MNVALVLGAVLAVRLLISLLVEAQVAAASDARRATTS